MAGQWRLVAGAAGGNLSSHLHARVFLAPSGNVVASGPEGQLVVCHLPLLHIPEWGWGPPQEGDRRMFCSDYILSFFFHAVMTYSVWDTTIRNAIIGRGLSQSHKHAPNNAPQFMTYSAPFVFGGLAGGAAALVTFPMDFVRRSVLPVKSEFKFFLGSLSTVPYSSVFFGLYFCMRDPGDVRSQARWASVSSVFGCAAELPFDKAKHAMFHGNRRTQLIVNMLYAPFASMMLIMYDKSLSKHLT